MGARLGQKRVHVIFEHRPHSDQPLPCTHHAVDYQTTRYLAYLQSLDSALKKRADGVHPTDPQLHRSPYLVPGSKVHEAGASAIEREPPHSLTLVLRRTI